MIINQFKSDTTRDLSLLLDVFVYKMFNNSVIKYRYIIFQHTLLIESHSQLFRFHCFDSSHTFIPTLCVIVLFGCVVVDFFAVFAKSN